MMSYDGVLYNINSRMKELERMGWVGYGVYRGVPGVWWKDGRYLYIMLGRKRVYIGCDKREIVKALSGVDRAREYYDLLARRAEIENWIDDVISVYPRFG
mgnify:CR=1 FL=1